MIITFSPTGGTRKVADMIAGELEGRKAYSQVMDLTREDIFHSKKAIADYIRENAEPHDRICVGAPVYAGHLPGVVKDIIAALPVPGGGWSAAAGAFVTWGGVSSGLALEEAAAALRRSGRIITAGMKVVSYHSLSGKFAKKLNEHLPGEEARKTAGELAGNILETDGRNVEPGDDISRLLSYQDTRTKIQDRLLFNEQGFGYLLYPGVRVDPQRCSGCGACVKNCPVQRRKLKDGISAEKTRGHSCIHCGVCYHTCPSNAIDMPLNRFEKLLTMGVAGRGPLACREREKNKVYSKNG